MFAHLILTDLLEGHEQNERLIALQRYSAERQLAVLESPQEATDMSIVANRQFEENMAEWMHKRGFVGVTERENERASLKHNGHARLYKVKEELDDMADVVVGGLMALDYNAAALTHMYRKSGLSEGEADVDVANILGEAFKRQLEELRSGHEKLDVTVVVDTVRGQS